jgi:hypothetical protein
LSWRLGFPPSEADIKAQAIKFMALEGTQPHGKMDHWWEHLLHSHAEVVKLLRVQFRSPKRFALSAEAIDGFYTMVADIVAKYELTPDRIYNLDETGTEQLGGRTKALVPHEATEAIACGYSVTEHVSNLTCIRADGYVMPPLYIFKGNYKTIPRAFRLAGAPEGSRVTYTSTESISVSDLALSLCSKGVHHTSDLPRMVAAVHRSLQVLR